MSRIMSRFIAVFEEVAAGLSSEEIAIRIREAGGRATRQAVAKWRAGSAMPSRANVGAIMVGLDLSPSDGERLLWAWLDQPTRAAEGIAGIPVVVVDVETTGLPSQDHAAVIEIGAVYLDGGRIERAVFSTLVCPPSLDERADRAMSINKIDREALKYAPGTAAAGRAFKSWVRMLGYPPMVAFNARFDREMMARAGILYRNWFCLMQAASAHFKRRISLDRCCAELAITRDAPHRALSDARDAAAVLRGIGL